MNKCEWKDTKVDVSILEGSAEYCTGGQTFCPCGDMIEANKAICQGQLIGLIQRANFCPYCGVDIRKPDLNKEENNMDWKKLEIDNLPPDILTGDYDFEYHMGSQVWRQAIKGSDRLYLLDCANNHNHIFRYRKPEPKHTAETLAEDYILSNKDIIMGHVYMNQERVNHIKREAFIVGTQADIPPE